MWREGAGVLGGGRCWEGESVERDGGCWGREGTRVLGGRLLGAREGGCWGVREGVGEGGS